MATAMPGGQQPGSKSSHWQQRRLFLLALGSREVPGPFRCPQLRGTQVLWGQRDSGNHPPKPLCGLYLGGRRGRCRCLASCC